MHWTVYLEGGPQRVNHAAVAIGSKIYSFGGYSSYEGYEIAGKIDIHVLDTDTYRWYVVQYQDGKAVPFKRYGHTVVAYRRKIYLWGGRNDLSSSNVLHCYDIDTLTWSIPVVHGIVPLASDGHAACIIGDYMYISGGFQEETEKFSDIVYRLSFLSFTWEEVKTYGDSPLRRDFHTASAIGDRMYIFGGRSSVENTANPEMQAEFYCNKIMYLSTKTMTWETPEVYGDIPCGRRSHTTVVYKNALYIFGGYNAEKGEHLNDILKFDPVYCTWSKIIASGNGPCARRRHCACVAGDQMFLFGGSSPCSEGPQIFAFNDEEDQKLIDHSDLYVLDFFPSLKRLCQLKVIASNLDTSLLPRILMQELNLMVKNNAITRYSYYPRRDFGLFAFSA